VRGDAVGDARALDDANRRRRQQQRRLAAEPVEHGGEAIEPARADVAQRRAELHRARRRDVSRRIQI
jgi:hypothetical protein